MWQYLKAGNLKRRNDTPKVNIQKYTDYNRNTDKYYNVDFHNDG